MWIHWLLLPLLALAKNPGEWKDWALLLNAEAEKREAVRELKNLPDLDASLGNALKGPDRRTALLVIRETRRVVFAEELFRQLKAGGDWELVSTLNTLLDNAKNKKEILDFYRSSLLSGKIASEALLLMLEGLKTPLSAAECGAILKSSSQELKLAVFKHAAAKGAGKAEFQPLLRTALKDKQLALPALDWLGKEPRKTQTKFRDELEYLSLDSDDDVSEKAKALLEALETPPK